MASLQTDRQNDDHDSWERTIEVVDVYLQRRQHGQLETIENLTHDCPDVADAIQRVLPVVSMLEDAAEIQGAAGSAGLSVASRDESTEYRSESTIADQFGRYRVDQLVAKGAMGAVYLAYDTQLQRRVALKIPRFADGDGELIERFTREARSMAMIEHPNVCPVFDFGELDGVHFLAMTYVEGRSLADLIKTKTIYPARDAATIVMKVAHGLDAVHRTDIVHRDVKPSNIIIRSDNEPVLMDFGLAHMRIDGAADLTRHGTIVGSPAYMSPEQVDSDREQIGPHTDVYSLGVILYELLCGRRPFEGQPLAVLRDIKWTDPPRPGAIRSDVDPRLEAICLKAIAKVPGDRFGSAAELAGALEQFLGCHVDVARGRRVTATKQRLPRVFSLVIALSLLVGVVGFWAYLANHGRTFESADTNSQAAASLPLPELPRRAARPARGPQSLLPDPPLPTAKSTGKFFSPQTLGGDAERQHVALADVDSDGDLDVFITTASAEPLGSRLWLNDSFGKFTDSGQRFNFEGGAWGLALGDFDRDGDLDAYVSCLGADSLLMNEGGVFTDSGQRLPFPDTRRAALGDLDNDGDLDVYLPSESFDHADVVLVNDGKGHLADSGQRIPEGRTRRATLGDFDGDGDLDVYRANLGGPDSVWVNDGDGYFEPSRRALAATVESHSATVFDIDADGDLDILVAENQSSSHVWLNNGAARFTTIDLPSLGHHVTDFTLGDLNGDGITDAWISRGNWKAGIRCQRAADVVWLRGESPDSTSTQYFGAAVSLTAALGDLDGDGDLDVVAANHESPARVWINRNIGERLPDSVQPTFLDNGQRLGNDKSKDVVLGDLDLDGDLDAFVSNERGPDRVWYNNGTGQFAAGQQVLGEKEHSNGAALGDLDRDGRPDVMVGGSYGAPLCVWFNQPESLFTKVVPDKTANWVQRVALHDFDNDGDLDAIFGCEDPPQSLLVNEGNGRFKRERIELPHDGRLHALELADMDQDGKMDVLIGCANPGGVYIWHNSGNGTFTAAGKCVDDHWVHSIAVADINGDRALDFATANTDSPSTVWLNQSGGVFARTDQNLNPFGGWHVLLRDIDNDGDEDLICANDGADPIAYHLNDGQGRFGEARLLENALTSYRLALGDLDNDGDLDVFVANDGPNRVWLNQTVE